MRTRWMVTGQILLLLTCNSTGVGNPPVVGSPPIVDSSIDVTEAVMTSDEGVPIARRSLCQSSFVTAILNIREFTATVKV